jgi:hypothetical protein
MGDLFQSVHSGISASGSDNNRPLTRNFCYCLLESILYGVQ